MTTTFRTLEAPYNGGTSGPQGQPGPLTPYPSTINVTGLTGAVTDVNATLEQTIFNCYPDIDVLLVGPGGQKTMLMGDAGPCPGSPHGILRLTFDDEAATGWSPGCGFPTSLMKPSDDSCVAESDPFTPPAPPGPYLLSMSVFDGGSPNGTWALYAFDDSAVNPDAGGISLGWTLTLTTPDPEPTTGNGNAPSCEGVPATIVGTAAADNLTGTPGRDVIQGVAGSDRISGGAGDDVICGAEGGDRLMGKGGADTLIGGAGSDLLLGGKRVDKLFGGSREGSGGVKRGVRDRCPKAGPDQQRGCRTG